MMQSLASETHFSTGSSQRFLDQPRIRILWPLSRHEMKFDEFEKDFMRRRTNPMDKVQDFVSQFHEDFSDNFMETIMHGPVLSRVAEPSTVSIIKVRELDPKDKFELTLDVRDFSLEDLTVKLVERKLVITGVKQGQKKCKEFKKEIDLPRHTNLPALTCSLTSDGLLKIEAPSLQQLEVAERTVPIRFRTSLNMLVSNGQKKGEDSAEKAA
ncbi:heat shock protein 30-like [Polyodon spathula]|nr:heat shock protein 30-like [Polyodon spathula]